MTAALLNGKSTLQPTPVSDQLFISCDWGTSNFRLRLVEKSSMHVLAELESENGIGRMHTEWKEKHIHTNEPKESFLLNFLAGKVKALNESSQVGQSTPIVISGMASSTVGIRELGYATLPYPVSGSTAITEWISAAGATENPVLLVSGVRADADVIRGEETQLTGLVELIDIDKSRKNLFILPGTHSKHIEVVNEAMTHFKTYMTGELFALISKQSILANSVVANKAIDVNDAQYKAFRKGVRFSIENNVLNTLFTVRTNQLFKQLDAEENYFYLSGLLIGAELSAIKTTNNDQIVVAAAEGLVNLYRAALEELGFGNQLITVPADVMEKALIAGQRQVLKNHSK
jgi:2-dehydro-3-deoxygalactonokinase